MASLEDFLASLPGQYAQEDPFALAGGGILKTQLQRTPEDSFKDVLVASLVQNLVGGGLAGFGLGRAENKAAAAVPLIQDQFTNVLAGGEFKPTGDPKVDQIRPILQAAVFDQQLKSAGQTSEPLFKTIPISGNQEQMFQLDPVTGDILRPIGEAKPLFAPERPRAGDEPANPFILDKLGQVFAKDPSFLDSIKTRRDVDSLTGVVALEDKIKSLQEDQGQIELGASAEGVLGEIKSKVPKQDQKAATQEYQKYLVDNNQLSLLNNTFDTLEKNALKSVTPLSPERAEFNAAASKVKLIGQKLLPRPVSDLDMKTLDGLVPVPTDKPSTVRIKQQELLNFIQQNRTPSVVLEGYGVTLPNSPVDSFGSRVEKQKPTQQPIPNSVKVIPRKQGESLSEYLARTGG